MTGVDFCIKHINEAKKNNPNIYIVDDIENFQYTTNFDLIMMLFSLLHIPKRWRCLWFLLKNGFCGNEMLWSDYKYDEYIELLNKIGFKMLYSENQNKHGLDESLNWLILKK